MLVRRTGLAAAALSLLSGCMTSALIKEARERPAEMVLLPLTLSFDAIGYGLLAGFAGSTPNAALPAMGPDEPSSMEMGFPDPGPWVTSCEGPLWCPMDKHFVCEGRAGDCECRCEITPVPECIEATAIAGCRPAPERRDAPAEAPPRTAQRVPSGPSLPSASMRTP